MTAMPTWLKAWVAFLAACAVAALAWSASRYAHTPPDGHGWWWHFVNDPMNRNPYALAAGLSVFIIPAVVIVGISNYRHLR